MDTNWLVKRDQTIDKQNTVLALVVAGTAVASAALQVARAVVIYRRYRAKLTSQGS